MASARYLFPYIFITAFQYVFGKDALSYVSPLAYGALTCAVTSAALFVLTRGKLVLNRDTLLFAAFYWASGVCWLFGLNLISSAQSAILSFTMPLFAIPLSVYVLRENTSRVEVYGAMVGFTGIVLYNIPLINGSVTVVGAGLTLADAFFWALFSVYMKKLKLQDTGQTLLTASFVSFLLYSGFSFLDFSVRPTLSLAIDVGYIGLLGGVVNFLLWSAMLKTEKLSKLTTLIFIAPIVTLVYGAVTAQALPGYITLGGVVLIFIGIYASNVMRPRGTVPPVPVGPSVSQRY